MKSNNSLPIKLLQPFIFTRYLFIKDEVKISLLTSLLDSKKKAYFWAYELYYSGFDKELLNYIFKIYYDFYATLNPTLENIILEQLTEYTNKDNVKSEKDKSIIVYQLINLLFDKKYNMDIFMLRQINNIFYISDYEIPLIITKDKQEKINKKKFKEQIICWFDSKDYLSISNIILEHINSTNFDYILNITIDYFKTKNIKIIKTKTILYFNELIMYFNNNVIQQKIILLSKIMRYFVEVDAGINNSTHIKPQIIPQIIQEKSTQEITKIYEKYKTYDDFINPRFVLKKTNIYFIDQSNYLSLFNLSRNKIHKLNQAYWYNWLYYASYSPIWYFRIRDHNGNVDIKNKKIIFENDDDEELFYNKYAFEPDEQSKDTQNRNIQQIYEKNTWKQYYKTSKGVNYATGNNLYSVGDEFLDDFEKIIY
jgi:hypothetical protein